MIPSRKTDPNQIRQSVSIRLMIEQHGLCNFLGMTLEALEEIETELSIDSECFVGSQQQANLEYQKRIIELTMSAVDLDTRNSQLSERKEAAWWLADNVKRIRLT